MAVAVAAAPTCLLCAGASSAELLCRMSFGAIARCRSCGLVRVFPPRTSEDMVKVHGAPEYFHHPYFEAKRHAEAERRKEKLRRVIRLLTSGASTPGAKLLDIGCDTGALLQVARDEFGFAVAGIEVAPEAARTARNLHGLNVSGEDLLSARLPEASFDAVTLVDVLEHVADPLALLRETRRILRPGGRAYIQTSEHDALLNGIGRLGRRICGPAVQPLLEKLYIPYHEFYFTLSTLDRLARQAGFQILRHAKLEFPLDEFGHGLGFKLALMPIFALQALTGRQTLQEMVVERPR